MTRPVVPGAGLRGPGSVVFNEQAKEMGRHRVLTGEAIIHRFVAGEDEGGAPDNSWEPDDEPIEARREPIALGGGGEEAEQMNETSSHRLWLRMDSGVTAQDRVEMDGSMWTITAKGWHNDGVLTKYEIREGVL